MADVFAGLRERLDPGEMAEWPKEADATVPEGCLLDLLGIRCTHLGPGVARAEMAVGARHLNQRGVVQGGAFVTLADAAAGWATRCAIPDGCSFTTVELNAKLTGTARLGDVLVALVTPVNLGRSTVVLTAEVMRREEEDRPAGTRRLCAHFSCTQLVRRP